MLFRIQEQVVKEYVIEFLSSFTFRDNIMDLDNVDTMVFQLGGEKRSMTMRQFIIALGLYTDEEMGNNLFEPFYESCFRNRPHNYDPTEYVVNITTRGHYDTRHPPSYTSIRNPIHHLAHRLLALSVAGRHSGKEKVTLDDLFLLHSMNGWVSVDVPWHVAKFFADKAKGYKKKIQIVRAHLIGRIARLFGLMTPGALRGVTLGPETSLLSVAKLVELGICKYNALGYGEIVDDVLEVAGDEGARAGMGQANVGGVRCHPNMTTTNRLRAMDERLGDIETDISRLVGEVDELTYVVSRMSEQYDQFYEEFGQWRTEQERFQTWNTNHLSQLLAHHHIDHTRYNETPPTPMF
ncbi:hypothetical protein Tco_0925519 [Tanacetum coccineum]|uniref:Uncharacterized protein n=1 Tax=Tanacetum coccineum TaxID=301880 RepID=A0ABQ5D740_9ASTR